MTVRAGMANLILTLRSLTDAGATDYTVNGVQYHTDQQLQDRLDERVQVYLREQLEQMPEYLNSTTVYKQFAIPSYITPFFEEEGGGTGGWFVKDAQGVVKVINSDYTVNYEQGIIVFTADQKGARNWLDCRAYNMYKAAATVWKQKAAFEMRSIDWSNTSMSIHASQRRDFCLQMAAEMDANSGVQVSTMYRNDEARYSQSSFNDAPPPSQSSFNDVPL